MLNSLPHQVQRFYCHSETHCWGRGRKQKSRNGGASVRREKGACADLRPPLVITTLVTLNGAQVQSYVLCLLPAVPGESLRGRTASHLRSPENPGFRSALTLVSLKPWRPRKKLQTTEKLTSRFLHFSNSAIQGGNSTRSI